MQKVRVRSANYLGKVDIGMPETMLPAKVALRNPKKTYGFCTLIDVTMAFWEADSRHAGELSVFVFREKINSALIHIGQTIETNHQNVYIKASL